MWTSLPTALMALLVLDHVSARHHLRRIATAGEGDDVPNSTGAEVRVEIVHVVPMPVGTVNGVVYSGIPKPTGPPRVYNKYQHPEKSSTASIASSAASIPAASVPAIPVPASTFPTFRLPTSIFAPAPISSSTPTATPAPKGGSPIPFLRGVNLGGWLVLEKWMNDDCFSGAFSSASDQYTFDSIDGSEAALEKHWSTFFTESDIKQIAATGINALRIPIGYWSYDNSGTSYKTGADAYLEKAIGWARNAGMKVWVDCHGSPGSQNGFDNSGRSGDAKWQSDDNMDKSISVLKIMAAKYGKQEYADVVVGLQLVNEPISWGANKLEKTKSWTKDAYKAVKEKVENENLVIVMHDGFMGGLDWTTVAIDLIDGGAKTFGVDEHLYQLFTDSYNAMTQSQHITAACGWAANLAAANAVMPTYVGEWSAATNICVNPDGSTTAGKTCSVDGCQCQSDDWTKWNKNMIGQIRRFVEAQLDVFESSSSGYFIWAAKGPGGWGFLNGIANGAIPNPVTDRKYPNQCGGPKRREVRGSLGLRADAF